MVETLELVEEWLRDRAIDLAMGAKPNEFGVFPETGRTIVNSPNPDSKWVVGTDGVGRPDGRFFIISAVEISVGQGREVTSWYQPMIFGDGQGYILMIEDEETGAILLRAKTEPGNLGLKVNGLDTRVLLSPPFQASQANMDTHGAKVPLIEFAKQITAWEVASEDGGRFYEKCNFYGCASVNRPEIDAQIASSPTPDDFIWVSRELLRELRRKGLVNGHLRSAMSLLA